LREAAFLEAEARERAAEADAKATDVVSKAIAAGDIQAIQFFLGQKYVEALQAIGASQNSKLVLMPLEAAGVTGAIAGIGELLRTMGSQGRPQNRPEGGPPSGPRRRAPERALGRDGDSASMIAQAFDWTWAWIIAGAIIAGLEIVVPGVFLLWIGIGAVATGLILARYPDLALEWQFLVFAVSMVSSVGIGFYIQRRSGLTKPARLMNREMKAMIGNTYVASTALHRGPRPHQGARQQLRRRQ
jgi:membrane protein implicated in regulation of membrane protease activity